MGAYYFPVCHSKKEYLHPHRLNQINLKFCEHFGSLKCDPLTKFLTCAAIADPTQDDMPRHKWIGVWYGEVVKYDYDGNFDQDDYIDVTDTAIEWLIKQFGHHVKGWILQ